MAAAKLDALWDDVMGRLSQSYSATLDCLDKDDLKGAADEYSTHFVPAMKKLFSEVATTYPLRFAKVDNWCIWTKEVYTLTRKNEELLRKASSGGSADSNDMRKNLLQLREEFRIMHEKAGRLAANDYILAFHEALLADEVAADGLRHLRDALGAATPSAAMAAAPDAYEKAKTQWAGAVDPVLSHRELSADDLATLRTAVTTLYRTFGVQFE